MSHVIEGPIGELITPKKGRNRRMMEGIYINGK